MEKIFEEISGLDNRIKIPLAMAGLLLIGFIASSLNDPVSLSGPPHPTERTQDLGFSGAADSAETGSDTKVVTSYRMTLKVSNIDSAIEDIESETRARGGFIESSSRSRDRQNRGSLTVSVPANASEGFENDLEERYEVRSKDVDRTDVTDSYNELEAEVESLKTEYQRLNELINQTDDVSTLVDIQERLSTVRSQLNYKQQRLDQLEQDIQYSTFHINLEGPQSFENRFDLQKTVSDAYSSVFDSLRLIILGTGYLVPFGLIYLGYRAAVRLKRKGF